MRHSGNTLDICRRLNVTTATESSACGVAPDLPFSPAEGRNQTKGSKIRFRMAHACNFVLEHQQDKGPFRGIPHWVDYAVISWT